MPDTLVLARANARALETPKAAERLLHECYVLSVEEKRSCQVQPAIDHDRAADAFYNESQRIYRHLREGACLLAMEERHRLHTARVEAERVGQAKAAAHTSRCQDERVAVIRNFGALSRPHRDPILREAARVAGLRIAQAAASTDDGCEDDFAARCADLEAAAKALVAAVGAARREAKIRIAAARAAAAVEALASKAAA